MKSTTIGAMQEYGGFDLRALRILLFLHENSTFQAEALPHCGLTVLQIAKGTGLSTDQVKRGLRTLSEAGAIARRQLVKAAGEAAVTVLTDRAMGWLTDSANEEGQGSIPADMPRHVRDLLVFESPEFVTAVARAWKGFEPLPETLRSECSLGANAFGQIEACVRQRLLDAAETVAEAHAEERVDREQLERGIVQFDCDDGVVQINASALQEKRGAVAAVDLLMVRDVLRRVRERCPGMVTVERLPKLVAEAGYSRTIGFVSAHNADVATRILAATMAKRSWSRPKGIKEKFYVDIASASRFSTGVQKALC
jgi:hypothetical protein